MTNREKLLNVINEDIYTFLMRLHESMKHDHFCVLELLLDEGVDDCGEYDCDDCIRQWLNEEESST